MLSDEKMDRKIREHVKEHPVILPEDYQTMVQEQIKKCCEGELHMNKKKQRKRKMIAAACVILCVGVCGTGGVRAGMNYAKQRAEQTSEKEQEALWTDAAKADADTFSRELSQKEQKRLNELAEKYQTEGLFPDGSILQISDKSEIVSDQICFLVQNSTFYLPEKALNDEQMLEFPKMEQIDAFIRQQSQVDLDARIKEEETDPFLKENGEGVKKLWKHVAECGESTFPNPPCLIIAAEWRGARRAEHQSLAHMMQNMWIKATALNLDFQIISVTENMVNNQDFCDMLGLPVGRYGFLACVLGYAKDNNAPQHPRATTQIHWL